MEEIKKSKNKKSLYDYYPDKEINLSENAIKVLERRYLKRDEEGILLEKPKDMFIRVAGNIASAEKKYGKTEEEIKEIEKQFFNIMTNLDFLPNSPTLMNAGKELQQLAACFVLPVGDSMNAIFEALKETALIQKSGGGVGYSFSNIRPKNDVVLSTKGVSSGPISFMTVFNAATDTIKQGGTRRGANMGILRVDHPDILDFIISKDNNEKLTNFNISVGVTERFMKAVENDDEYEIMNPRTKEVVDKYRAREVFGKIVEHAWKNGDPGIIFLDRLNKDNPTPNLGQIESTNPCISGETLISTDRGFFKARDLYERIETGEDIKILFDKRALEYKVSKKFTDKNLDILESRNIKSWNRGKKDTYKLVTYSGYELEATAEHKVLTINGYKKLIDLVKGDEVLIQPMGKFSVSKKIFSNGKVKELNNFTKRKTLSLPEYWSVELGEILGWLIGDGWLREDRVGFTFGCEDKKLAPYFNQIIRKWYNYDIKETVRENRVIHLSYHSKGFIEFFKELGVKVCTSSEKEVPVSLFSAPKEAVAGFLKGIFSADGNIDDTDGTIKISSSSKKLLKGVQVLLLGLGVLLLVFRRGVSGMGCGMGDHGGHGRSDSSRNELTTSADESRDAHQHHGSPERTEPSGRAAAAQRRARNPVGERPGGSGRDAPPALTAGSRLSARAPLSRQWGSRFAAGGRRPGARARRTRRTPRSSSPSGPPTGRSRARRGVPRARPGGTGGRRPAPRRFPPPPAARTSRARWRWGGRGRGWRGRRRAIRGWR